MIPGFKIENDKLILDVYEILKYPKLAKIYKADTSKEKEFAYKVFMYISHIADKKGYCRIKGLSAKEAHIWATRNSGLKEDFKPDKMIQDAIEFIKSEFDLHPVEDVIENTMRGLNVSLKMITIITQNIQDYLDSSEDDIEIDELLNYEENIKRLTKYANEIPSRIEMLAEQKVKWDEIEKGTKTIRGGKQYKSSYDGEDDLAPSTTIGVESLN